MKLSIVFVASLTFLGISRAIPTQGEGGTAIVVDAAFLEKQKFLFEIVYRLKDPLIFEEHIKFGEELITKQDEYEKFDPEMIGFHKAYENGAFLPKGEFFGSLVKSHLTQSYVLFKFFYYAKSFETFKRNVCWARMHINEGVFYYALSLAVEHRADLKTSTLPPIHEVFPEHFFNSKVIFEAAKFNYDSWTQHTEMETKYPKIFHDDEVQHRGWQWWTKMGREEKFYEEKEIIHRDNADPAKIKKTMEHLKVFWMPTGYTSDIEMYNSHSKLSYFTEDVGLNEFWYQINIKKPMFLSTKTYDTSKDLSGAYWIFNIQQIIARHHMECLSVGHEMEHITTYKAIETGYNPHLISGNGMSFDYRENSWDHESHGPSEAYHMILRLINKISETIEAGSFALADGTAVDLRKPQSMEMIGTILQGHVDASQNPHHIFWTILTHMFFSGTGIHSKTIDPHVLLNYETSLRDPLFYMIYQKVVDVFHRVSSFLAPYTHEELFFEGVTIENVEIDKLTTYFDYIDYDISNVLTEKMKFVDGKYDWDKMLAARQMRLNHKTFNVNLNIKSEKPTEVVIRTFLGPKYDQYGHNISLEENRKNFIKIDEFTFSLQAGENTIKRNCHEFSGLMKDRMTYSELYKNLMSTIDGKDQHADDLVDHGTHNEFPINLLLPRGWINGLPMQMFFMVGPVTEEHGHYSTYPLDRSVIDYNFFVPNMMMKDVMIYHEGIVEQI